MFRVKRVRQEPRIRLDWKGPRKACPDSSVVVAETLSPQQRVRLVDLPDEVLVHIFSFIGVVQISEMELLNKRMQAVVMTTFRTLERFETFGDDDRIAMKLGFDWLSHTIFRFGGNLKELRTVREVDFLQLDKGKFIVKLAETCPNIERIHVRCSHADRCPSELFLAYAEALKGKECKLTHLIFSDESPSNCTAFGQRQKLLSLCPRLKTLELCRWRKPLRQLLTGADGRAFKFSLENIEFSRYATATFSDLKDLIKHSPSLRKITFETRATGGHGFPGEPKKEDFCSDTIERGLISMGTSWSLRHDDCVFSSTIFKRSV